MELKDKVIVVTGAFGRLGHAVVKTVQGQGALICAVDRAPESAELATMLSGASLFGGVDLGDATAATQVFERIVAQHGGVDGLVNVAGGFRWEAVDGGALATWDAMYQINTRTAVAAIMAALPHLSKRAPGARIVNIGANAAAKAAMGNGAYAASKAGVAKLTESLADELKDRGITVNAVLPSIIDTPVNRADMPDADHSRWVTPQQIADAIAFLLSPRSQAITGALLPVVGRV